MSAPTFVALASMTLGVKGWTGVVERIEYDETRPSGRLITEVARCDHKHRKPKRARECGQLILDTMTTP